MLYKETCLYIIYSVVLKNNKELHSLVRTELTERLTDSLSAAAQSQRKQYMYAFSRAFYDEYQRTHNMERTLSYAFWSVAAYKYPSLAQTTEMPCEGLSDIYRYIHRAGQKAAYNIEDWSNSDLQ